MAANVRPRIRLDRKQAKKGDLIEVKALVSHVMESGQHVCRDSRSSSESGSQCSRLLVAIQ